MVAPVVLITLATIFANGLLTAATTVGDRMFALNRERRDILGGHRGEMPDENSLPPGDRDRLSQISDEEPMIMRRLDRIRSAILIIWIAIGLLVLSVAAIAAAATAHSEAVAFVALALVLAGVLAFFTAVASLLAPLTRSTDALIEETRGTGTWSRSRSTARLPPGHASPKTKHTKYGHEVVVSDERQTPPRRSPALRRKLRDKRAR